MRHSIGYLAACAAFALACGGDSSGDNGGGDSNDTTQSCYDLCQAQDAAEMAGNCPGIGLSTCKALCDAQAGADCQAEQKAMYDCMLTGTFDCGLVSAQSDADCKKEQSALDTCQGGGSGSTCTGADANGFCPSVTCPCSGGDQNISGSISENGQCACVDTTTCLDLCF